MNGIKEYWAQLNIYLNKANLKGSEKKIQLIEILLLIGTLSATFKFPEGMTWIYLLFALSSISYFIFIQENYPNLLYRYFFSGITMLISILFSGIISGQLLISMISASMNLSDAVNLFWVYYLVFTFILWTALRPVCKPTDLNTRGEPN